MKNKGFTPLIYNFGFNKDDTIYIAGDFTINPSILNYVYSNCVIFVAPEATITINTTGGFPPKTVVFDHCTLLSCDPMWKGIVMTPDSRLEIENSSTVQDAIHAVTVAEGTTVNITNSTFSRNHVGIWVPEGDYSSASFLFDNNTFDCLLPLKTHPNEPLVLDWARYGMELNNIGLALQTNFFNHLCNGIYAKDCNLSLTKCIFHDIQPYSPYTPPVLLNYITSGAILASASSPSSGSSLLVTGFGKNGVPTFENCFTGVYSELSRTEVYQNRMENMGFAGIYQLAPSISSGNAFAYNRISSQRFGVASLFNSAASTNAISENRITVDGVNATGDIGIHVAYSYPSQLNTFVLKNHIEVGNARHGIFSKGTKKLLINSNFVELNDNQANLSGISLLASDGASVSCDSIVGNSAALNPNYTTAIYTENSQGWYIACNATHNIPCGIAFRGDCSSPDFFKANHLNTHHDGLRLFANSFTGQQLHTGNKWYAATYSGNSALNSGIVGSSPFRVHQNPPSIFHPNGVSPGPNVWFDFNSGTPASSCSNSCYTANGAGDNSNTELAESDFLIATGNIQDSLYEAELQYSADRYLYEKLRDFPSLLPNGGPIRDFYESQTGGNNALFSDIQQLASNTMAYQPLIQANDSLISLYLENINVLDSIRLSTSDSLVSLACADSVAGYYAQITLLKSANITLLTPLNTATVSASENLRDLNGQIVDTHLYESNEKAINEVYFRTISKYNFRLNPEQQATIMNIANQCPYTGGEAVYRARAIRLLFEPEYLYQDSLVCGLQNIGWRKKANAVKEKAIQHWVIPNPTSGSAVIQLSMPLSESGTCRIYNLLGETVHLQLVEENHNQVLLDLSRLSSGLYLYEIETDKYQLKGKMIIHK